MPGGAGTGPTYELRPRRQTWDHLGTDVRVGTDGNVASLPAGDVDVVRGRACLVQDVYHRLTSQRGCLRRNPTWGCDVRLMIQEEDTPQRRAEALQELALATREEPRIDGDTVRVRELPGGEDQLVVEVSAAPLGSAEPFILVLGYATRTLAGGAAVSMEVVRG